ncbi:MAG: ATP phosphoribosyltransferase [Alphaproteobacteria bacterium]|nr:ATP phosphoribosyltransferase [Alphaproteobacteria bacterium]
MSDSRLRLALQKSGRLSEGAFDLLAKCGLTISRAKDNLYGRARELPIDVLLVRDDDIPGLVDDGVCDLGIVGENVFEEHRLSSAAAPNGPASAVMKLGFARCRLMLAAPKAWAGDDVAAYEGKRIATSYPALTKAFLDSVGVSASIAEMSGSVEIAPKLRIAEAICDIVSTGATLEAHGLKPTQTVFTSEAILVRRPGEFAPEQAAAFNSLMVRVNGVIASRDAKYVMLNAPRSAVDAIIELLPGADSPTILELAGRPDVVAIHAVCGEQVFWSTLEKLKALGATAILVAPIEKMMP